MNGRDVQPGPTLTTLHCGGCYRVLGQVAMVPGLVTRHHCPRCKHWTFYTVPAAAPAILPRGARRALLELRRGYLEELRADGLDDDQARALRRRARIRQLRAVEQLTGAAPADVRDGGAVDHG